MFFSPRWNDLWLNEGFATYFEDIGTAYVKPNYQIVSTIQLNPENFNV